jgi:RND family efflux transporter MFP subunit
MKAALKTILLVLAGAGLMALLVANPMGWRLLAPFQGLGGGGVHATEAGGGHDGLWTCGMHPQVLSEEQGLCPICHMDLTPMASEEASQSQPAAEEWVCPVHPELIREDGPGTCPIDGRPLELGSVPAHDHDGQGWWTCPMHPEIVQDEPGACPICGMDLVYKEVEETQSAPSDEQGTVVTIDASVVQKMNVRTELAERGDVVRQLRTVGFFTYDEERMVTVTMKFEGFIEKTHVSYVGQRVLRGAPLFEIYSRELVQTQQELLSALDYAERLTGADEDTRRRAQGLVDAGRQRLAWWDITESQVRRIEETGEIRRTLTVTAPTSGIVMRRPSGLEGMAVRPGSEVLHLADVSRLWLNAEVYEDQLAWIGVGTEARVELEAFPGLELTGRVQFIDPEVTERTRAVAVTLAIPNEDGLLKVGMWATVRFESALARQAVTVPSQAVLRTGERNVVVVDLGGGRFAPRPVQLGSEGKGRVEIRSGISAGERIVTSAQFLIDSESTLREAVQKMVAERRARD